MSKVIGGLGISHTPSMGFEYDKGLREGFDPRWQLWYDGTKPMKPWIEEMQPDQIIIVYNDHLNTFTFDCYPTFAIGVDNEFAQANEGWGVRDLPDLKGDTDFGWHVTRSLIESEFDMTVCQEMPVDHGVYSWLPYIWEQPWDVPILPIAVNMIRLPIPSSQRFFKLGKALRCAVESHDGDTRVLIMATGGMSHQISGGRFGIANEEWDRFFLKSIEKDVEMLMDIPHEEIMKIGGTEAAELIAWFAMRGALSDDIKRAYDYYTFPQLTGCGVVAFEEN